MGRPKSELLKSFGTSFEILKGIVNEVLGLGGTDDDVRLILRNNELRRKIAQLIMAARSQPLSGDFIPPGWTLIDEVAQSVFDVSKIKEVPFLKKYEKPINGEEMSARAVELKSNIGIADGQYMLADQERIPTELRDYYILLAGALVRDADGRLYIPCLYFSGHWCKRFLWNGGEFGGNDRFCRSDD